MKKKRLILVLTISIFIILLIVVGILVHDTFFYNKYDIPKEVKIEYTKEVNLFDNKLFQELITDKNVDILNKDEKINTDTIGRKKYTLEIKYDKKKYFYIMSVKVIDVTPPVFISAPSTVTTTVMNIAYPCDRAIYGDDYDGHPTCTTEGEYDIENPGTYHLNYVLADQSGNTTTRKVDLKVVEYGSKSTSNNNFTPTYIQFSDVVSKYKNDNTMIGIDVSKWQGNIDFEKVKNAGCEFVIIRIGVQAGKDYEYKMDGNYKTYIQDAKKAGLKVGVYLYNTSLNYNDGVKAAKWVIDALDGEKLDYGVAYDWENYQYFMEYGVSLHTLSMGYQGFKITLEKAGYEAHFYASKFYLENFWMGIDEPVWLAHYISETNYGGKYYMWQRTGSGKIDGINDNSVDIDIMYKQ